MRAGLLAAALLTAATPLAAQDDTPGDSGDLPPPGKIAIVSASESIFAGQWGIGLLNPEAELCLMEGEEAVFASDRVIFQLVGQGCFTAAQSERIAFAQQQRTEEREALDQARAAYDDAIASGDGDAIERAFARLAEIAGVAPDHAFKDEPEEAASPPGETRSEDPGSRPVAARRTRTGAVRDSAPPPTPPRPVIFRLAGGSPAVLERFARGTILQRTTALCLNSGEQATVTASTGQTVTYTGPGCLKRQAPPTRENIGGFTFG